MLQALVNALENMSVVDCNEHAVMLLRAKLQTPEADVLADWLMAADVPSAERRAVLSRNRRIGALVLWIGNEHGEGWFHVQATGLQCIYRH